MRVYVTFRICIYIYISISIYIHINVSIYLSIYIYIYVRIERHWADIAVNFITSVKNCVGFWFQGLGQKV